ncbi:YbaN family protein [Breoghania sp. L-A4]|uniref:YbaN family protein n=1 Tax=Breoghania sp. L-A4 TaxID=2304600 RepID=UPI0020C042A9|nr:YbaN family protein [Breoghania sp. L-A4]
MTQRPPPSKRRSRLPASGRMFYGALGFVLVGIGLVGAVLPLLPTTIFLILAVPCFARSNERMETWILNHPQFGTPVRRWIEHGAIR